jgi:hypothetical protein
MSAAAELQAYVWLYLDQAQQLQYSDIGNALYTLLAREWPVAQPNTDTFRRPAERPPSSTGAGVDYGFDVQVGALWFRRDWFTTATSDSKLTEARRRNLFDTGRELYRALLEFLDDPNGYSAWHGGGVAPVIRSRTQKLIEVLSVEKTAILSCHGAVVFGTSDPLIWIGTTHDDSVSRERSGSRRAVEIQARVERAPEPRTPSRWASAAAEIPLSAGALHRLIRAFVQEHFVIDGEFREGLLHYSMVDAFAFAGLTGAAAFWYAPSTGLAELLPHFLAALAQSAADPNWIFVCTQDDAAVSEIRHRLLDVKQPLGRFRIVDTATARAWTSLEPWLWTAEVGAILGLNLIVISDRAALHRALVHGPFAHLLTQCSTFMHPSLASATPTRNARLCVNGRPGAGKSTALSQMLAGSFTGALAIIIDGNDPRIVPIVQMVLEDVWHGDVVFVLDNLQRDLAPGARSRAGLIVPLIETLNDRTVAVLGSYWSSERRAVRTGLRTDLAALSLHDEIALDPAPRDFLNDLARCAAAALGRRTDDAFVESVVTAVALWDATPHTLLSVLHDKSITDIHRHLQSVASRGSYWTDKFWSLARAEAESNHLIVLRILSAMRALVWDRYPRSIVEAIFCNHFGKRASELDDALELLEDEAWVRVNGDTIDADEVQIWPRATGMMRGRALSPELLPRLIGVMEYFVEDGRGIPDDERERTLFTIGLMYSTSHGMAHGLAAKAHRKAVELYGPLANGGDSLSNLVLQLFSARQYEEGFQRMDELFSSSAPYQTVDIRHVASCYRDSGDADRLSGDLLTYLERTPHRSRVLEAIPSDLLDAATNLMPHEEEAPRHVLDAACYPALWAIVERYAEEYGALPDVVRGAVSMLTRLKRDDDLRRLRDVLLPYANEDVRRLLA